MKHRSIFTIGIVCIMLLQTSCWDMVEIEERALIGAIIIDIIEENIEGRGEGTAESSSPFCEDQPDVIKVVFGVNIASKVAKGERDAGLPVEVKAANIPDAMEILGSKIPRVPFYGQIRLLVLTKRLIENEKIFREILDEFERKAVINQNMKIVVFDGGADEVFDVEPKASNLRSQHIVGVMKNARVLSNTLSLTLSELTANLRNSAGSAAIPLLEVKNDKERWFSVDKLALIKDYSFMEILDTKYVKSYKIITEELEMGRKLFSYKDVVVPYYIASSKRKILMKEKDGKLNFRVRVEFEGDLEQLKFDEMLFDPKIIREIEGKIEKATEEELSATTKYFKESIGEDYLGFKEYTNKYHNKIFNKYKDNWEETFKNADIVYQVDASIRRIGTTKK